MDAGFSPWFSTSRSKLFLSRGFPLSQVVVVVIHSVSWQATGDEQNVLRTYWWVVVVVAGVTRRASRALGIIANAICESACERCVMNGNVYFVLCRALPGLRAR